MKKNQQPKTKTTEAPTLPWDWRYEESKKISDAQVKEHFKKMEPVKKEKPINPGDLKFFIGMCKANKKKFIPLSDYDRSITKSFEKMKSGSSSDVP